MKLGITCLGLAFVAACVGCCCMPPSRFLSATPQHNTEAPSAPAVAVGSESYPVRPSSPRRDRRQDAPQSGLLTAGRLDDVADGQPYGELARRVDADGLGKKFVAPAMIVRVVDAVGRPVGGADVKIDGTGHWFARKARTKSDGTFVLVPNWDRTTGRELELTVIATGLQKPVHHRCQLAPGRTETVVLQDARTAAPWELNLAFVIDCTGSMGDELEYLKAELQAISRAVARRFPNIRQRYALVFYRDMGDTYVTRVQDFTSDLDTVQQVLAGEHAAGGGDYPEAVDEALADAGKLSWRDGNVARVCFHLADAPPHDNRIRETFRAVDRLRQRGVVVYPLASSGVRELAEFTLRTEALLTGGEYLFLTDDSGVGRPHATPVADRFDVEKLRELMVRMVAQELAGLKLDSRPGERLRTAWGEL